MNGSATDLYESNHSHVQKTTSEKNRGSGQENEKEDVNEDEGRSEEKRKRTKKKKYVDSLLKVLDVYEWSKEILMVTHGASSAMVQRLNESLGAVQEKLFFMR